MPQPFYVINPRAVNWLEYQAELGILLQPSLGLLAFVNDVVIEDQRDGFGASVVATQRSSMVINRDEFFFIPLT